MFPFFLQLLIMKFFFLIIVMAFVMHTVWHVGFHVKVYCFQTSRKLVILWKILLKLTGIKSWDLLGRASNKSQDLHCKTSKTDISVQEDQNKIIQNQCGHLVQKNMQDQATNTKLHRNKEYQRLHTCIINDIDLLKMAGWCPKHVEAFNVYNLCKNCVSSWD